MSTCNVTCKVTFNSVAILAQVGIQAPDVSFRCICHLGNSIKTRFESGFCVLCTSHDRLLLVALSSSVGNLVVLGLVRSLWWHMGIQLGRIQPRAGLVGKHSRDQTSLSRTSYLAKSERKKGNRSRNLLSQTCHAAVETILPLRLGNQAWSLAVIHHASNRKRTVKMQSWKTAQKPVRTRSTRRSRRTTNCGKFSRTRQRNTGRFSTVTISSQKMQSLDDEKAALLAARRQFLSYPCKVGSINRKTIWSESRKRSNRNRRNVWKSMQKWLEADHANGSSQR